MLKLQAIGRLGNDATTKDFNGKTVINFSIATDSKRKGEKITKWISCSYWPQSPAIAPYLTKGTLVFVEGEPDVDIYKEKATQKLTVFNVELLGGGQQQTQPVAQQAVVVDPYDSGDLPF